MKIRRLQSRAARRGDHKYSPPFRQAEGLSKKLSAAKGRLSARVLTTLAAAALVGGVALLPASVAAAEPNGGCGDVITDLRDAVQVQAAKGDSPDVRGKIGLLFSTAIQEHPECKAQLRSLATLGTQSRPTKAPGADAKGFLGPIGWLWNNVYYRVYQGSTVMMVIFGWALFLAPVLFVFSGYSVIRGAGAAWRRPTAVPTGMPGGMGAQPAAD